MANILHPYLLEPVAYEEADCYTDCSIRLAAGDWLEEVESAEAGEIWVGLVQIDGSVRRVIGAAGGRDEAEARFRLTDVCDRYINAHWRRRP